MTSRGKALHWLTRHRGLTERPAGSNRDDRQDGITAAQKRAANGGTWLVGLAWCGVWALSAALAGGVRPAQPWRWASVSAIEDDARAGRNGFHDWTHDPTHVERGDLAVMWGRGIHVVTVRQIYPRLGLVRTDEGNTSSGNAGSQDNGGGSYARWRKLSEVYGFARVDYPNQ